MKVNEMALGPYGLNMADLVVIGLYIIVRKALSMNGIRVNKPLYWIVTMCYMSCYFAVKYLTN